MFVLLTLAAGQFLMTLDSSVMNVSIATVANDVGTTVTGIQGAITAYTLVMAALMIVATTNGEKIWAFRYSSEHDSRSLYFGTRMDALKALYPESEELEALSDETRVIVSEPLGNLPGAWNEAPESHVGIVQPGADELKAFSPRASS